MSPITPTAPQSETRTPEPARCGASSLPRPPCRAGKLECGPRKARRPSQGLPSLTPPAFQGSAPWAPFLKCTTDSRPPPTPTGPATNHQRKALEGSRPSTHTRAHHHPESRKRGRYSSHSGSENTDRPLAAGGRPSALSPSQQRRAHLQGLPHGPRQRGQRWPVAAPSPTPLFFSWPRRREASRPGRRKTAPQLSPRAPRLPHPPLPAAATAPSGVSAVAAGVWGVAGGRGGAGLRREPAPPLGAWPRRPGPGAETQAAVPAETS